MTFIKDFFYINYHERRALLVILTTRCRYLANFDRF